MTGVIALTTSLLQATMPFADLELPETKETASSNDEFVAASLPEKLQTLLDRLGGDEFRDREKAEQELDQYFEDIKDSKDFPQQFIAALDYVSKEDPKNPGQIENPEIHLRAFRTLVGEFQWSRPDTIDENVSAHFRNCAMKIKLARKQASVSKSNQQQQSAYLVAKIKDKKLAELLELTMNELATELRALILDTDKPRQLREAAINKLANGDRADFLALLSDISKTDRPFVLNDLSYCKNWEVKIRVLNNPKTPQVTRLGLKFDLSQSSKPGIIIRLVDSKYLSDREKEKLLDKLIKGDNPKALIYVAEKTKDPKTLLRVVNQSDIAEVFVKALQNKHATNEVREVAQQKMQEVLGDQ